MVSIKNCRVLFICGTPLHILIAIKIIEIEKLDKENCRGFFFSKVDGKKDRYYFNKLSEVASEAIFFKSGRGIAGQWKAYKALKKLDFDAICFGALTSRFTMTALGLKKHSAIFTFDDGTGNVSPSSFYRNKYGYSIVTSIILALLSRGYYLDRIRKETQEHYTIFPNLKNNVSPFPKPVSFISSMPKASGSYKKCSVYLGTSLEAFCRRERIYAINKRLLVMMDEADDDVYYIPHPRGENQKVFNKYFLETEKIAEEAVIELLRTYSSVDLYGFCSSAQINLSGFESVKQFYFKISEMNSYLERMCGKDGVLNSLGWVMIDLDNRV